MAELCAPGIELSTLRRIASVESGFNPLAIGVVGGRLQRQPRTLPEALATVRMLHDQGFDYSLGIVQIHQKNFAKYGLTPETAFDPCVNLRVGSLIFKDCYKRAGGSDNALGDALSCYYSGNFKAGYSLGYVAKVQAAGANDDGAAPVPVVARSTRNAMRRTSKARPSAPEPLFVTVVPPPLTAVAPVGDISPTAKGRQTALLF